MLDSLSPYALLQASKPRQPAVVTTAYDLFSAAQSAPPSAGAAPAEHSQEEQRSQPAAQSNPAMDSPASMPLVPRARTHYISDIKRRHSEALRRAYPPPP